MAPGNVARQGLEEGMLKVHLGPEDFLVARALLAHFPGNELGEGIDGALLGEVPAGTLGKEDLDYVVEATVFIGIDTITGFLGVLWWHLYAI